MPTKKHALKVYVTDEEYVAIKQNADEVKESMSEYLKKAGMKYKMLSRVDAKAASDLLNAKADFGRVGGLLKLAITQGRVKMLTDELRRILRGIEQHQSILMVYCKEVTDKLMDRK